MFNRERHEFTAEVAAQVLAHVSWEGIIKNCTPRGNGKAIKTNRPADGIYAYIWRQARFHSGIDPTMPVMDEIYLANAIEDLTKKNVSIAVRNEEAKAMLKALEAWADKLVDHVGLDRYAGAKRWGRVLGWC